MRVASKGRGRERERKERRVGKRTPSLGSDSQSVLICTDITVIYDPLTNALF